MVRRRHLLLKQSDGVNSARLVYIGTATGADNGQCQTDPDGYCESYRLTYKTEKESAEVNVDSRRKPFIATPNACSGSDCLAAPSRPTVDGVVLDPAAQTTIRFTGSSSTCFIGTPEYRIRYNSTQPSDTAMPDWSTAAWLSGTTRDIVEAALQSFILNRKPVANLARTMGLYLLTVP